jgi:hypothetical protein
MSPDVAECIAQNANCRFARADKKKRSTEEKGYFLPLTCLLLFCDLITLPSLLFSFPFALL